MLHPEIRLWFFLYIYLVNDFYITTTTTTTFTTTTTYTATTYTATTSIFTTTTTYTTTTTAITTATLMLLFKQPQLSCMYYTTILSDFPLIILNYRSSIHLHPSTLPAPSFLPSLTHHLASPFPFTTSYIVPFLSYHIPAPLLHHHSHLPPLPPPLVPPHRPITTVSSTPLFQLSTPLHTIPDPLHHKLSHHIPTAIPTLVAIPDRC